MSPDLQRNDIQRIRLTVEDRAGQVVSLELACFDTRVAVSVGAREPLTLPDLGALSRRPAPDTFHLELTGGLDQTAESPWRMRLLQRWPEADFDI